MIYFICLIITILLVKSLSNKMILKYKNLVKINITPVLVAMPFLLISILRYNVGKDYMGYVTNYFYVGTDGRDELIFSLIIKLANRLNTPHFVAAAWGVIFCLFMFCTIYRLSENKVMSVVLLLLTGFFFMSLSAMRQGAATATVLFAFSYLRKKDYIKFYIFVVFASMMHSTSIVYAVIPLILLFLENTSLKKQNKFKKIFIVACAIIYLQSSNIRTFMIFIAFKFDFYAKAFNSIYDTGNLSGSFLFYTVPFFLICLISSSIDKEESLEFNCYWLCAALAMLSTVLMPIIPNAERIIYLFLPVEIVSVPFITNRISKKRLRYLSLFILFITSFTAFYVFHITNDTYSVMEYHFIGGV